MNTDDRQQHIDTLADLIESGHYIPGDLPERQMLARDDARRIFGSTDPAVHDALTAALIAHADPGRVLAALADAGWLPACDCCGAFTLNGKTHPEHGITLCDGCIASLVPVPREPTP